MRSQLHDILAETAAWRPEGPALTFKATTLTYRDLWQRSAAVGAGLQGLGCAGLPLLRRDRPRRLTGNVDRVLYLAAFEVHASYDPLACRRWKGKWRS